MKRNLIAHKAIGSSDKVYMACVRKDKVQGDWVVIGKWGRRTAGTLQAMVKFRSAHLNIALAEAKSLFNSKLKEGYKDIEGGTYNGPVSRGFAPVVANLEPEAAGVDEEDVNVAQVAKNLVQEANRKAREQRKAEKKDDEPKEGEAICLSNDGMAEQFDVGIEYVYEHHDDPTMIWVYDKYGKKVECFKERFKFTDIATASVFKQFTAGEQLTIRRV